MPEQISKNENEFLSYAQRVGRAIERAFEVSLPRQDEGSLISREVKTIAIQNHDLLFFVQNILEANKNKTNFSEEQIEIFCELLKILELDLIKEGEGEGQRIPYLKKNYSENPLLKISLGRLGTQNKT